MDSNKIVNRKEILDITDFVLLDMDGTLLDRYFDDYFWEYLLPERYADKYKIELTEAQKELMKKYKQYEGTLKWTDLDFWSKELGIDVPALKRQVKHMIELHPYVEEFLEKVTKMKKKLFLVTNAHYKTIDIKLKEIFIGKYFDSILSSFDVGCPKEDLNFWIEAQKRLCFDKDKTLFIDDSEKVLKTARQFGIKYIIYKARFSTRNKPKTSNEFLHILDFNELI